MLSDQQRLLRELIWEAVGRVGRSATRVADDVLPRAFPRSVPELEQEGGLKIMRTGLIQYIKPIIDAPEPSEEQIDLAEIDPSFGEIVKRLPKNSFFVPSRDEYLPVALLIAEPALLDEARKFTRQKGLETLATADTLDQLYAAVMDAAA